MLSTSQPLTADEARKILDTQAGQCWGIKEVIENVLARSQPAPHFRKALENAVQQLDDMAQLLRRD